MADATPIHQARSEAAQPSLWDRLVDDLPGLMTEIAALREGIVERVGEGIDLDALVEAGLAGLRGRDDLDREAKRLCQALILKTEERARLERRGVVVTGEVLRDAVRRDIEMLFNIERLESVYLLTDAEHERCQTPAELLADFPQVRASVLNYGIVSFAGKKGSDFDIDALGREVREILRRFEPRLRGDTIKVEVKYAEKVGMRVDIEALLLLTPVPERLRFSTVIDLDNGHAVTAAQEV